MCRFHLARSVCCAPSGARTAIRPGCFQLPILAVQQLPRRVGRSGITQHETMVRATNQLGSLSAMLSIRTAIHPTLPEPHQRGRATVHAVARPGELPRRAVPIMFSGDAGSAAAGRPNRTNAGPFSNLVPRDARNRSGVAQHDATGCV
jgi:hypothetical protein